MGPRTAPLFGALLLALGQTSLAHAHEPIHGFWMQVGSIGERIRFVPPTNSRAESQFSSGWSLALGHRPNDGLEWGGALSIAFPGELWSSPFTRISPSAKILEGTCALEFKTGEHYGWRIQVALGYARMGAYSSAIYEWSGKLSGHGPTGALGIGLRIQPLSRVALCGFAQMRASRIGLRDNQDESVSDAEFSLEGLSLGLSVRVHLPPHVMQ